MRYIAWNWHLSRGSFLDRSLRVWFRDIAREIGWAGRDWSQRLPSMYSYCHCLMRKWLWYLLRKRGCRMIGRCSLGPILADWPVSVLLGLNSGIFTCEACHEGEEDYHEDDDWGITDQFPLLLVIGIDAYGANFIMDYIASEEAGCMIFFEDDSLWSYDCG